MASLGHVAVGLAAGRLVGGRSPALPMLALSAVSLLPDLDAAAFTFGVPYSAQFGHRGASHSLAFALAVSLSSLALARWKRLPLLRTFLATLAVAASHPLLDALTHGGLGVAVFWPFSGERFFAPWTPLPVAPIGAAMVSARGLRVLATEAVAFLPFLAYALWPRRRAASRALAPLG